MEANHVGGGSVTFEMVDTDDDGKVTSEEFKAAEKVHGSALYSDVDVLTTLLSGMEIGELIELAPPGTVDQNTAELFTLLRDLAQTEEELDKALKQLTRSLIDLFVEESKAAADKQKAGAIAAFSINMIAAAATIVVATAGVRCINKAGSIKGNDADAAFQRQMALNMSQLWTQTGSQAAGVAGSFSGPVSEIFNAIAALLRASADEAKEQSNLTEAEQGEASESRKQIHQALMDFIKQTSDANTHAATAF